MSAEQFAAVYRGAIIGRMQSECATDCSDAEIARTLAPCVCGGKLVAAAKYLRGIGQLKTEDVALGFVPSK